MFVEEDPGGKAILTTSYPDMYHQHAAVKCGGLSEEAFVKQVNDIGIAITGQTGNLAPADKKIYALRDVTATVENISLIASSIMSKKLASGADAIVLDVKTGSGAFMKNEADAVSLAKEMVRIGKGAGRSSACGGRKQSV